MLDRRASLRDWEKMPDSAAITEGAARADETRIVQFRSDGLGLSPGAYARLLAEIAERSGIAADDYSRGGVVAELETRMAALLGKEAAVFLPTGTLANHLAVRRLTRHARRVLVQQESHLWNDEGDCVQHLSGLTLVPLAAGRATFTLAEVKQAVAGAPEMRVAVPVGAIAIETPVRRVAGAVFDPAEMRAISGFARARGIGLHLDGARLLLEAAYTGIAPRETAALFDTVYVSLWKYLNAANGAILAGPHALLDDLYHERRMFGGSLPRAWPDAAVAFYFLDGFAERFAEAVAVANRFLRAIAEHPRVTIERAAGATNVTVMRVKGAAAATLPQALRHRGIEIRPALRANETDAEFGLHTNETILRRKLTEIIDGFASALDETP
jgi:threonine aldolase